MADVTADPPARSLDVEKMRDYEKTLSGSPAKKRIRDALLSLREKWWMRVPTISSIAIQTGAMLLTWKVGDVLVESRLPGAGDATATVSPWDLNRCIEGTWPPAGQCAGRSPWDPDYAPLTEGQLPETGSTYYTIRRKFATPGDQRISAYWYTGGGSYPGGECASVAEPAPPDSGQRFTVRSNGSYCTHTVQWLTPAQVWLETAGPIQDAAGGPTPQVTTDGLPYPGDTAAGNLFTECIVSQTPECKILEDVECHVYGDCPDPAIPTATAPSCAGTASQCAQGFRDAGFTGTITSETATLDEASPERSPEAVIATVPAAGETAAQDMAIRILANPPGEDMPVIAPDCVGLTYDPCVEFFREAGFTGASTRTFETFESADLDKGPAEVTYQSVAPGARVRTGGEITIRTNPLDADMPRTYRAPAAGPGESVEAYLALLDGQGLTNILVQESETENYDYAPGNVVVVAPSPGTRVRKSAEVVLTKNRLKVETRDSRCERDVPPDSDPAENRGNDLLLMFEPHGETFLAQRPVSAVGETFRITVLRWGKTLDQYGYWGGWGYRHIYARHGWTSLDVTETAAALATTPLQDVADPNTWLYYGPPYAGSEDALCQRFVVVQTATRSGEPAPKDIITSFSATVG